ncbi:pyruvate dehydrogenase (acetyl-transferring) E1 component subunit alpha [Litoribrevibacter albus]|uniref:Pyruvate dehydrogenase E1 component subunit alpha n=1 Tax=Litoribrevibacter albus TaxID=1473156 RepID=A0AA37W872_9GAMM|nr:pyruvate dehydrogenase (acetyl-transferring) E1 component subunit alpha [Litoribrevibacter albus]GLQ32143.1 pyruvate dehydrogenase E1 component subunit alpha [Litoribrevibacter albus]
MQPHIEVPYQQCLSIKGQALTGLSENQNLILQNEELLKDAYRWMTLTRVYDQKAVALQRTGQMGTYPASLGQEAIGVAVGMAMAEQDTLVPYYRDHATFLLRGWPIRDLLLYWGGDERGSAGGPVQDFPISVPIATQSSHAVGVAAAMKIKGEANAVVTTIGDGGTSKGDFLEAINVAGAWQLPVVFVISNNQYAISVPRTIQCGAKTLAQKAVGAGIPFLQVDGNDFVACYDAMQEALERARSGKGAYLIEAVTYRLGDHTTADDATRYRSPEEVKEAWSKEPIKRLQTYLAEQGWWDESQEKAWQKSCDQRVEEGIAAYKTMPPEPAEAMFDYLYEEFPEVMSAQLDLLYRKVERMRAPDSVVDELELDGLERDDSANDESLDEE